MTYDIFLSYRRSDGALAEALVEALQARGIRAWYDQMIQGGVDWRDDIVGSLQESTMLVILFSEQCNSSKQLNKELAIADHLNKDVVPVLIEETEPRGNYLYELASRNWIQIYPEPTAKLGELADRLAELVQQNGSSPEGSSSRGSASPERAERAGGEANVEEKAMRQRALRDLLPFRWWDVFPLALLVVALVLADGHYLNDRLFGDLEPRMKYGSMALYLSGFAIIYGAIVFPVRYYLRRRGLCISMVKYLVSNLLLVGVFLGLSAMLQNWSGKDIFEVVRQKIEIAGPPAPAEIIAGPPTPDEIQMRGPLVQPAIVVETKKVRSAPAPEADGKKLLQKFWWIWLACGVVAFVIFGLLSTQRAIRSFRKNKVTL